MPDKRWLYCFNFATPHDAKINYLHDYDDALGSRAFWVDSEDAKAAQAWGDVVAAAWIAWLFEAAGASQEPWNQGWPGTSYGSWIEDRPELLKPFPGEQTVSVGQMPDFEALNLN